MGTKPTSRATPTMDIDVGDDDIEELDDTNPPAAEDAGLDEGPQRGRDALGADRNPPGTQRRRHDAAARAEARRAARRIAPLPPPSPLPPAPRVRSLPRCRRGRRSAAAAVRLSAALPQPQPQPTPASVRPTMAIQAPLSPSQQQSAAAVDALFGNEQPQQWGMPNPRSVAAANEPTARPGQLLDPALAGMMPAEPPRQMAQPSRPQQAPVHKTGMRKGRSKLQLALWVLIGIVVIGGGVFAGFQIRAMRLTKQIAEARDRATGLAKADTWTGWTAARDSLANIVGASATLENRAALARARAIIAYEFGDGVAEAKTAVDQLGGKGGFDGAIAAAYVALALDDTKGAKTAADAALAGHTADPAALYASGQAKLLGGER